MIKDVIPRNETVVSKSIEKMVSKFRESVDSETKALLTNSMDKDTFTKFHKLTF